MRKPFDVLAEGRFVQQSRGDWPSFERLIAALVEAAPFLELAEYPGLPHDRSVIRTITDITDTITVVSDISFFGCLRSVTSGCWTTTACDKR
jgi:hypothetical protein